MADYPSALTGAQMDIALLDVAQHNSEAWAVGTRNGYDVQSGDDTFNNNSKHYAEVAKTAAGVAQGAIPSGTAGAVFFDRAQSLTAAQKLQARANIAAANSNRNLLDNPFFTVNQRNFTSVSATNNVYSVDRWKINNGGGTGGSISKTSAGYMQLTTGSTYISLQQMFGANELAGKTVTMSINDNGTIYTHSFVVPARSASDQSVSFNYKTGCNCNFFIMNSSAAYGYIFQLSIGTGYSATIRAVKLELGSYSTLINDVPPDYGEELRKCMRYFQRIQMSTNQANSYGFAQTSERIRFAIPLSVPLRTGISNKLPTLGTMVARGEGQQLIISSLTGNSLQPTNTLAVSAEVTEATGNRVYILSTTSQPAYIDISADL